MKCITLILTTSLLYYCYPSWNDVYVISVVTFHKIFFTCISTSSLPRIQRSFYKIKLIKTSLRTQLKRLTWETDFIFQQRVQKKILMILFSTFCSWIQTLQSEYVNGLTTNSSQCFCVYILYTWQLWWLLEWLFFLSYKLAKHR